MSYLQNFKYDLTGDPSSPKLVFLHGVMGSGANWRKITNHFKDSYHVLTFDQRGHGRSFRPQSGYGPEHYADDLKKILKELGWNKIFLVGHSMGGRNALEFAASSPEVLRGLIIEDIGPEGNRLAMDRTIRLIDIVPTPFPSHADAKRFFNEEFPQFIKNHPQRAILAPYFYTNIETKSDGTADWRFHKDGIIESLRQGHFQPKWEHVRGLNVPTLFIRGELSDDFPESEFSKVLAANKNIEGVTVAGASHWVHFDKPSDFAMLVKSFIDKIR